MASNRPCPFVINDRNATYSGILHRKWPNFRLLYSLTGGDLEQIERLLGHASIQTGEKYLAMRQNLAEAVNDKLEIVDAEGE